MEAYLDKRNTIFHTSIITNGVTVLYIGKNMVKLPVTSTASISFVSFFVNEIYRDLFLKLRVNG